MDPVTRAATEFLAEAKAFWRASPGRVLPMIAEPSERGEVVKALRLAELAPSVRRPLFLYEAPFVEAHAYFDGLVQAIRRDYEAIREGVAGEGLTLPAFSMDGMALGPVERAALAAERVAALLGDPFEGVLVALVPEQVTNAAAWRESLVILCRSPRSVRVRLAVGALPEGRLTGVLGAAGARFQVDRAELLAYLKGLGGGKSNGPAVQPSPSVTEIADLPVAERNVKIRGLLLDAATASAKKHHVEAAGLYREARALCSARGLALEEAGVLIALGGACLGAWAPDLASDSYGEAAELAQVEGAWQVVCQAWLGVGGAHLARARYELAAVAYRAAADAAKRGGIALLHIEASRLAGTCLVLAGREDDALVVWKKTVDQIFFSQIFFSSP
jgi:hypothetical protein